MTNHKPKDKLNNILRVDDKIIYSRQNMADVYVGTVVEIVDISKIKIMPFDSITPPDTVFGQLVDNGNTITLVAKRTIKLSEAEYLEHKLKK